MAIVIKGWERTLNFIVMHDKFWNKNYVSYVFIFINSYVWKKNLIMVDPLEILVAYWAYKAHSFFSFFLDPKKHVGTGPISGA